MMNNSTNLIETEDIAMKQVVVPDWLFMTNVIIK